MEIAATPPRVLIADDEAAVLCALRMVLELNGCKTETVTSPPSVLHSLAHDSYDLLLMDLDYSGGRTSGREGLDLASQIRHMDPFLPVVAVTGYATLDLVVDAMRVGICDLIQKPWENDQLVIRIRRAIHDGQRRRQAARARDRELRDSHHVQRALLPRSLSAVSGWEIAVEWAPADGVGGDYYDVIPLSHDRLAVCIADVAGKGVPAAMLMSNLQAVIRNAATADATPGEVCARANTALCGSMDGGRFVTLFYSVLDAHAGTFAWSNAGHPPPLLQRADGSVRHLTEGGVVLGVFQDEDYREGLATVGPGDRIVLCTDGVTEAGLDGEEFGADGVAAVAATKRTLDATSLRDAIVDAALRVCRGVFRDDATLIVLAAR